MSIYEKITAYDRAVYWGPPVPDGMGGNTYPEAVEIGCRWTDIQEVVKSSNGEDVTSKAKIFTDIIVDENGYLYHGVITEIDPLADPRDQGAVHIRATKLVYNIKNTKLLRKAWI